MTDDFEPSRRMGLVLRLIAFANDGGHGSLEDIVHPEIEVPSLPGVAPGRGYHGVQGFRSYFAEARRNRFVARAAVDRLEVTAAGRVLASGELLLDVAGAQERLPAWFVYGFRDGLICSLETFGDEDTARRRLQGP